MALTNAAIPIVTPRTVLGLRTNFAGNIHYITDDEIVYPVGALLAIHNVADGHQRFIKLPEKGIIAREVVISPNKKIIAVSETGERPTITLYDSSTYKKKRTLSIPAERDVATNYFSVLAFTFDSKFVVAVSGEPDWILYRFRADRGKIDSSTKANNASGTGTVTQISCNPNDVNAVALGGNQVIKVMTCSEAVWKQFGYSKSDQLHVTALAWLSQERMIAGTIDGKILIFDGADLKSVFWAGEMPVLNLKQKDDLQQSSQTSLSALGSVILDENEDYQVRLLVVFPRGFVFAFNKGTLHFYEKETPQRYVKRNIYKIPDKSVYREFEEDNQVTLNEINFLSINPAQDRMLVTCLQTQIYIVKLWGPDISSAPEILATEMGLSLHNGKIGGMDICSWRSIFLTSGEEDRTLRLWNYESQSLLLCEEFQDDLYDVALHPTGLYALVGFSDKLRFLTILVDTFDKTRAFNIRRCKKCCFSSLGHLFAAANGNVIQIYSTITFTQQYVLKGHSGRITGISWSADDLEMCSCGNDGAVYDWKVATEVRTAEVIVKKCSFTCVVLTSDGRSSFAVGTDGQLRELISSNISRDVKISDKGVDAVLLSNSNQMLFVAAHQGSVLSVKLPLLDVAEYNEFPVHLTPVTHMRITYDDRVLITAAQDGNICIWKILNAESKQIRIDKDFKEFTDILITRTDLEAKMTQIRDLTQRTHELVTEHAYQMRQSEVAHNQKMQEVHEGYCGAIEELKEKNEQMEADHVQEMNNINMDIAKMKTQHEEFVQKLEANYNEKLIVEYDKYLRLEDKMSKMRSNYERELAELRKAKKDSEDNITTEFLQKLQEKEVHLEEMVMQMRQMTKEHELIKQQIEDDADREIYELKTEHEKEIKEEQDTNVRLRGETGIIKKRLATSIKEIEDLKHNVFSLENEHVKFKGVIIGLERDTVDLKKEIAERDATIQDKERRIYELKCKNQELEKFKFILDFKIKELKSQIEPRERAIREQTEQINDMVRELENLQRVVINLDLQIAELKEKLASADSELRKEIERNRAMKLALKTIRMDIHQASGFIKDIPKLTKVLKEMYHKYNADKDFATTQQEDVEAKNEFLRQREFLEGTIKTLKQQVSGGTAVGMGDKMRLVEENATLITETNVLRANLKMEERKSKKMESILGLNSKYMLPKVAQKLMTDAVATRAEIESEFQVELKAKEERIEALKQENARLLVKISEDVEPEPKPLKRQFSYRRSSN